MLTAGKIKSCQNANRKNNSKYEISNTYITIKNHRVISIAINSLLTSPEFKYEMQQRKNGKVH